uniref:Uncharacterized protein n=1 Tax=Anopheles epiroticus TaxID=199890 RepID=A0A182PNS9_9DIPT
MASSSNLDDPDLANLQSNFDEQQAKISALREIIRQTEVANDMKHATAQEKVKNIAQRLTHFKTKVTTSRLNRASSVSSSSQSLATIDQGVPLRAGSGDVRPDPRGSTFPRGRSESSGMEKCSLLRQQIEQNRQKMAERESSQREIEEKVIEIKHKLEATQQTLGRTGELDRSSTASLAEPVPTVTDSRPLVEQTQTVSDPLDSLRCTVDQSFLDAEEVRLTSSTPVHQPRDIDEQFNEELTKFEDSVRQAQVKRKCEEMLESKITSLENEIHEKERIIDEQLGAMTRLVNNVLEEDNTSEPIPVLVQELHKLQMKLLQQSYHISYEEAASRLHDSYGYDPLQKASECKKLKQSSEYISPLATTSDEANVQLQDALQKIDTLEQAIASQELEAERMSQKMDELRQTLEEKTIELNVMTANVSVLQEKLKTSGPKPLFPRSADEELETEATKLRQQLDESNKNMIKCKLKIKQLQKQVDTFKKTSSVHEEVAKLTEENTLLNQRLAEVEERLPGTAGAAYDSPKPVGPELQKRIEMLELTCQNQATAMQLLEEQKNDLSEDLNRTRTELQSLTEHVAVADGEGDNGRIASQMLSIELEEKLEKCLADKTELTKVLHSWEAEKSDLRQQLQRYADENAQLQSRIDKLSLEKVSSAESIEILENLTLHEKQEMENSEKRAGVEGGERGGVGGECIGEEGVGGESVAVSEVNTTDQGISPAQNSKEDLNESLLKLMEESKELMDKVELFTDERREVLEKLDAISIENQAYVTELDKLKEANEQLRSYSVELASAKSELEDQLRSINEERESIRQELHTVKVRRVEGESAALPVAGAAPDAVFDKSVYQQSLAMVETDITNYNKNKDKQKKMQLAKKLTVNAKTVVTMSRDLLDEYARCVDERAQLLEQNASLSQQKQRHEQDVVSPIDSDGCKDSAISTLETKLEETVKCLEGKASQIALLQEEIAMLKHELEVAYEKSSDDEPELLKVELNSKNDEILLLKKDIDALVDAKSAELLQIQHRLLEAQKENHQLKTFTAELQCKLQKEVEARTVQEAKLLEAQNASSGAVTMTEGLEDELLHKQETINTLNGQIIELYRTVEEHQVQLDEVRAQKQQVEQKNEELLEKLKKFAANLKKKNVQCTELEKEVKRLTEANRALKEQQLEQVEPANEGEAVSVLREENEQLAQKLHHLNNELHRLLEQKYHMESECESNRGELKKLVEQLAAAQDEVRANAGTVQSLEAELDRCRSEWQTLQDELASKNGKIEKCKAIIKEKIKETQRLQERERRVAYLEDELRMTQSKLEDFHNQTLLLGRLKSEKEELCAAVRAKEESCKSLEEQLASRKMELSAMDERDSMLNERLKRTESWILRYREKWCRPVGHTTTGDPIDTPADLFSWIALLVEADQTVTQTLAEKVSTIRALETRLKEAEERSCLLHGEVTRIQAELEAARTERMQSSIEQEQTMERLQQQLSSAQADLQRATAEHEVIESQQTELHAARNEIERLRADLDAGHEAFEQHKQSVLEQEQNIEQLRQSLSTAQQQLQQAMVDRKELENSHQSELAELRKMLEGAQQERLAMEQQLHEAKQNNAEFTVQIATLRDSVTSLERQLDEEKDTIQRLTIANDDLQGEITRLQETLRVTAEGNSRTEADCDRYKQEYETVQALLEDEKQHKERLNELLKERDQQIMALQSEADELRLRQDDAGKHQSMEVDSLRQHLHELDQSRAALQASLDEQNVQCEEQARELAQLRGTIASLERQTQEDRTNISILTSLNGALNEDLDLLQQQTGEAEQRYQALLDEFQQTKRALGSVEADLQQQAEVAEQRHHSLSGELEQRQLALEATELQLQQETNDKGQLSRALQEKERECGELRQECAELQRSLEEAKSALASQPETKPENDLGMWDDADAGWGMGGDTARLEETIRQKDELIEQLGAEKDMMQQEITDLKVKSGKLLRKVKECKVKLDAQQGQEQRAEQSSVRPEAQDALLEQKVQQLEQQRTVLQSEKEALDRKLDMLESACEKLTEVKEHQDRQIEMLRESLTKAATPSPELEELRENVQQVTATLQMRESEIAHLNARLEQLTVEVECMEELRTQLSELQRWNAQLQSSSNNPLPSVATPAESTHSLELQLAELEQANRLLEEEKTEMSRELEVLNQQILQDLQFEDRLNKALLELDAKGVEIQMLRSTLDQLQQGDLSATPSTTEGGGDAFQEQILSLQSRVEELERERTELLMRASSEGAGGSTTEPPSALRVDDATVQEVLERQELEIVTLKEQLALRSAEYARLAARVDPTKLFAAGLSGSESATPKPEQQPPASADRVPKAELELALYMIYQRDMRCDELELELRNLIQERDTLQLRLSNALRMHEEFKMRFAGVIPGAEHEYGTSGECSIDASPDRSLSSLPVDERPISSLSGAQDLTSKLSELQSISYSKEKRWHEEREERDRQLTLIQRDLANMPVEAAAKLAGTDVTADADSTPQQSASTVLLNWILGKK